MVSRGSGVQVQTSDALRLYEVALGIVLGALLGWSARKAMQFGERKKWIDRQSFVAQYVSLAILSIGKCCCQ